jgi:extradiol dioxygenase
VTALVQSLAYIGFTSPRAEEWASFGPDLLGLELVERTADGAVRLRNDDHAWRISIDPGERDDLAYLGWSVDVPDALASAIEIVTDAGCAVHADDANLAAARQVDEIAWFVDPFGFRHEFAYGFAHHSSPFHPRVEGVSFVTGDGGLGHVVLLVPDLDRATWFFIGVLGMTHSDDVDMGGLRVGFLHCNPRHHTLGFVHVPGLVGIHHLMLEVASPDDVGRGYDRVLDAGVPLAMTLGRHVNDGMFSFYVRTPAGFEIEYGAGGRLLDLTHPRSSKEYDAPSHWGHRPPAEPIFPGILKPAQETTT